MNSPTIDQSILTLQGRLADMPFNFAYLGGSILSLLVTDLTVDAIRVTKDIDVMVDIRTRRQFHEADALLEKAGFKHDTREGAPICRWIYKDVTVDILPIREDVLGWNSPWFEQALNAADEIELDGEKIRVVSAPYFTALKLEAFEDRGKGDFLASTDFEDVICLFNGREGIVEEIRGCEALRNHLARKFKGYLQASDLHDAVEGFVQTESNPDERKSRIISAFKSIAEMK